MLSFLTTKKIKSETLILSIVLCLLSLFYLYEFTQIAGKYRVFTPDEFVYFMEAKALSANGFWQTPFFLDGNSSIIGDFGYHGISYALKDAMLSILFLHPSDPPLLLINFITLISIVIVVFSNKILSLTTRLKIALAIITHHVIYTFTFSYMQETIHYLFAVLALYYLYHIYNTADNRNNYLFYYLIVIIIATTFRYTWSIWGLALLPLAFNLQSFFKWLSIVCGLFMFAIFIAKFIYAPYPYAGVVIYKIMNSDSISVFQVFANIWEQFSTNIKQFFSTGENFNHLILRYLLILLLSVNLLYAIITKNRFMLSCSIVAWGYFISNMAFYIISAGHDERMLAILNPILVFSLISSVKLPFFYPIFFIQLLVFPSIVKEANTRNSSYITMNENQLFRKEKEMSYAKIQDIITDNSKVVVLIPTGYTYQGTPDYFIKFPIANSKGYPIHYYTYVNGNDLRKKQKINYLLNPTAEQIPRNSTLIYKDNCISLYKIRL